MIIEPKKNIGDIKIVSGGVSGTTVPGKYFDPQSGITYFDCPGFDDTRGAEQEIANAYYIQQVFQLAEKVKIVIVCQAFVFYDRLNIFTELIKKVAQLFPDVAYAAKSICLVVSKASPAIEVKNIIDLLMQHLQPQGALAQLDDQQQQILKSIINDEGKILFFYAPQQLGRIQIQAKEMIDKINALPYMQNPEVSIVISAQAREIVSQWRQEVLENITIQFEGISKLINNFYTESLAANVDIKSLNHKIIVTKNSLSVIMQNPLQALTVPKMTKEILLLHNIDPTEGIAAIDSQLTYISFIQQLQPHHNNDNISKGFYCILETVSSIESIITLKMQDNFTKQIELSNIKNDAIQQQMNSLIQSVSYKDQQINNLVRRLDDETNPEKVALREHEIELARQKLKEKILREEVEQKRKEHEEWLKNNPPEPDKTCLIFHHKIKCDNDFLNLTSKQQQKILNETNWSFE